MAQKQASVQSLCPAELLLELVIKIKDGRPMRVRAYHAIVTKLRARKYSKAWRQSQFGQTSACLAEKLTRWKINVANELENTVWKASNSVVFG